MNLCNCFLIYENLKKVGAWKVWCIDTPVILCRAILIISRYQIYGYKFSMYVIVFAVCTYVAYVSVDILFYQRVQSRLKS